MSSSKVKRSAGVCFWFASAAPPACAGSTAWPLDSSSRGLPAPPATVYFCGQLSSWAPALLADVLSRTPIRSSSGLPRAPAFGPQSVRSLRPAATRRASTAPPPSHQGLQARTRPSFLGVAVGAVRGVPRIRARGPPRLARAGRAGVPRGQPHPARHAPLPRRVITEGFRVRPRPICVAERAPRPRRPYATASSG